jgi:putative transposase
MEKCKFYDREFKMKAVQLGFEIGLKKGAKELSIGTAFMTRWRREFLEFGTLSFCGRTATRLNREQKQFSELKRKLKHELKESELELEIFKNASKYTSGGKLTIYDFIKNHTEKYTITRMCKVLGTDKIVYDKWNNQVISIIQRRINLLHEEITSIFFEYHEIYGCSKIAAELQSRGFKIKSGQVSAHMQKLGLVSKVRRNAKIKRILPANPYVFPNILNQQFNVKEPSIVWVSGIAQMKTAEGFLFLTIIMDLFDRKIIGWSLGEGSTSMETTMPAWEMAVQNRKIKNGLLFHSHRGVQYTNKMFSSKLDSYKFVRRSMSRIGNLRDNTISEHFFNSIKAAVIDSKILLPKTQMKDKIFEYLENLN